MDNQQQPQQPKTTSKTLWIVLIIVVLVIAIYGIYTYISGNTNQNTNTISNTNISTNQNINKVNNTNTTVNSNTNTAVNTNIDTSDWKAYTNSEYGYTMKYPSDWTYEDIYLTEDPFKSFPTPIRYSIFYSPEKKYTFVIGIKKSSDQGSIYYRTGIGAGEIIEGEKVYIDHQQVPTWQLVYQNKVNEIFFYPVASENKFPEIGNYQIRADFGINELSESELKLIDLIKIFEYRQVKEILLSLVLK